jgi:hypothetical protein
VANNGNEKLIQETLVNIAGECFGFRVFKGVDKFGARRTKGALYLDNTPILFHFLSQHWKDQSKNLKVFIPHQIDLVTI